MEENQEIKKELDVYRYYWAVPAFFLFILINYFTKRIHLESLDMNLMISIVSFLFGFLITITFSMLLTRISALKENLASETGRLVGLFLLSKHLGKEFHEKIKKKIDDYTINTLRNYTNYDVSREQLYGMYDDIENIEIKNQSQEAIANSFLYILGELEPIREKLEYLTGRRVEKSLKISNYVLGILLMALLFLNRGETFTNAIFIVLSTIIVFIILIIEDYDHLKIGDYTYNISNSEQLFDLLQKDRYYPQYVLNRTPLIPGKKYRIGIFDKKTKQEKIYLMQYNPSFKRKIASLLKKVNSNLRSQFSTPQFVFYY